MKVIELFSGIGGMQYALQDSGLKFDILMAADINTLANSVYKHNKEDVNIVQTNIQSLSAKYFNELAPEMIVMSPPCQPFTRVGLKKDTEDARTCPLLRFISLLQNLTSDLQYILLENVQGFEQSETRSMMLKALNSAHFIYQEFLLSPFQFGIPNSRSRYYLTAKRKPGQFVFENSNCIIKELPANISVSCSNEDHMKAGQSISDHLEIPDDDRLRFDRYLVPNKVLDKRIKVFDIVTKSDNRSLCFTKAYTHYAEGTGSIYCPLDRESVQRIYDESKQLLEHPEERLSTLKELRLRYFTPREVANLMCFPKDFSLPEYVTDRQGYRLLGNSINVHVVGFLISLMCQDPS